VDPVVKKVVGAKPQLTAEEYLVEPTALGIALGQQTVASRINRATTSIPAVNKDEQRGLPTRNRANYAKSVLMQVKAKFGTPTLSDANIKAVTRYAERIMVSHKLRWTHIAENIPYVVHLTFIPSEEEMRVKTCIQTGYFKAVNAGKFDTAWHRTANVMRKYLS
jgi:hypothetical protein